MSQKVIPIVPVPAAEPATESLYEARKKLHPRSVTGTFARWRWVSVWLTQLVFYGLPWLSWSHETGSRQAAARFIDSRTDPICAAPSPR